jgi:hypothetical protein
MAEDIVCVIKGHEPCDPGGKFQGCDKHGYVRREVKRLRQDPNFWGNEGQKWGTKFYHCKWCGKRLLNTGVWPVVLDYRKDGWTTEPINEQKN